VPRKNKTESGFGVEGNPDLRSSAFDSFEDAMLSAVALQGVDGNIGANESREYYGYLNLFLLKLNPQRCKKSAMCVPG